MVLSEHDPVSAGLNQRWGTAPATDLWVEGTPIRRPGPGLWSLRRGAGPTQDDGFEVRLPPLLRRYAVPLVFPSLHRSAEGIRCFTVHPLGVWAGDRSAPESGPWLVPTAPRLMAAALRALSEGADRAGLPVSYEATHHGPRLSRPAFFMEIGGGAPPGDPTAEEIRILAEALAGLRVDLRDRVAVGAGGGHYVPHFTELALSRRWAFGHLIARHVLAGLDREMARAAWAGTPGAEGILCARAADRTLPVWEGLGPILRDSESPRRGDPRPG
ncbi:MAG: D-aminoacyl-tRNA deacylase [Thermoplasmata archaeon]